MRQTPVPLLFLPTAYQEVHTNNALTAVRRHRTRAPQLVLQGFRVAVLVRSLSTETLNLLGSGVSYSYGDMTDYATLLDAMEDVDRVIFAAEGENELDGLAQVMRSFQDTRTFMYGDAEATKLTLLKMRRDADFNRWAVEGTSEDIAGRLASAGIGPKPCIAYWKRSPTGSHRNGVFVGKVFDTYLGSAAVSCSLSGLLIGAERSPVLSSAFSSFGALNAGGAEASPAAQQLPSGGGAAPPQAPPSAEAEAAAAAASAEIDRAAAAAVAKEVPLDLGEYSGLVLRTIGDGKKYTVVIRTPEHTAQGLEYHADFFSRSAAFGTTRLPFSNFVAVRNGRPVQGAPELDRRRLVGLALAFYPQRNDPATDSGEFYLSIGHIKAYRKRDEPEFVYISDAGVAAMPKRAQEAAAAQAQVQSAARPAAEANLPKAESESEAAAAAATANSDAAMADGSGNAKDAPPVAPPATEEDARLRRKQKGEAMLRASGLTYFIVRPVELNDQPRAAQLTFTQGSTPADGKAVSRADIAEVAVRSLLDPRACNVACTVSESSTVVPAPYEQDISKALEVLEPNKN